ncbi:MAG: hypothetical protein EBZ52_07825 [Actinobacteria bacterium]|nr:hypothetical protein [Actinomycetota bacterium]
MLGRQDLRSSDNWDYAEISVNCNIETWADILAGDLALSIALSQNKLTVKGDTHELKHALQVFDIKNLQS